MLKIRKKEPVLDTKGKILRAVLISELISLIITTLTVSGTFINTAIADFYGKYIFPVWSFPFSNVSNMFFISLTENIVVVGVIFAPIILIVFICCAKRRGGRYFIKFICVLLVVIAVMSFQFQMMHGINYKRTSIPEKLKITGNGGLRSFDEYQEALMWAYQGMITSRMKLGSDYNGVAHMQTNYETAVQDANVIADAVSDLYGFDMSDNYIRAKAVSLSHLWRFTDIVGFYDMFLGEANVNTDYLDILNFPVTLCHEIIHAKGYARESDANIAAAIACISSPRADFRYCGYYTIFMHMLPAVYEYSEASGEDVIPFAADPAFDMVRKDMAAYEEYETRFDLGTVSEAISEVSESANNAFLEANGQEGGTKTYHVPVDIYVEFYWRYVAET